jgi:hypothetical protein
VNLAIGLLLVVLGIGILNIDNRKDIKS